MGEKSKKFIRLIELIEPYLDAAYRFILPVLEWIKKKIWLVFGLILIAIFTWKAIRYHYGDYSFSVGQSLSIAFGEMLVVSLKLILVAIIAFLVCWLLISILTASFNKKAHLPAVKQQDEVASSYDAGESIIVESQVSEDKIMDSTHGQQLPVNIPENFNEYFMPIFTSPYQSTTPDPRNSLIGVEQLKKQLEQRFWTQSDLAKIALLLYSSNVLRPQYRTSFRDWVITFFKALSRDDFPKKANKNNYKTISRNLQNTFSNLINFYRATKDRYLELE